MIPFLRRMAVPSGIVVAVVAVTLLVLRTYGRALRPESYVFFCLIALAFTLTVTMAFRSLRVLADGSSEVVEEEAAGSVEELEVEKRRLLAALKELEFDLGMEKVSRADYDDLCAFYERRAIEVMRLIDEARAQAGVSAPADDDPAGRRDRKKSKKKAQAERKAPATTSSVAEPGPEWRARAEKLLAERLAAREAAHPASGNGTHTNGTHAPSAIPAAAPAPAAAAESAPAVAVAVTPEAAPSAAGAPSAAPPTATPAVAPGPASCACGAPLDPDSVFCKRCGTRVSQLAAPDPAKETRS